uniref:Chromo domain-containing protein n=1 Tax=Heterorhabditis bacteriophora TaxID=37862 RepID=A0A1I7XGX2_HETBA
MKFICQRMSPQPAAESVTRRGRGRRPRGKSGRVKVEEIESTETPVKAENAFHDTALMQAESSIEKNILKETESSITEEESIELSIENNRDAQAIEQQVVPMEGTECTTQQDVDDGSESGESDTESEPDEVEKIVDVKVQNNILKFRVRWVNCRPSDDTWEPEESFTGSESKMLLDTFREENRERIEELLQADKQKKTRRGRRSGPRWEYVAEPIGKDAQNELRPRELNENDPFYGQKAASTTGELKRLFDPSHKNSVTELVGDIID